MPTGAGRAKGSAKDAAETGAAQAGAESPEPMLIPPPVEATMNATAGLALESEPELYVRVNIEQTAKGFRYETTVAITGALDFPDMAARLSDLLTLSGREAREEIARREMSEQEYRESGQIGKIGQVLSAWTAGDDGPTPPQYGESEALAREVDDIPF